MAERKPLYQPWNEEEFISDFRVRRMNNIQVWMYRSLLQAAFFHDTRPFLPNDDDSLWILSGASSLTEWNLHKPPVMACFEITPEGLLTNKRVIKDWEKLRDYRAKMKKLSDKATESRAAFAGSSHGDRTITSLDSKVSKGKVSEVNESQDKLREEEDIMSLKSNITDKARELLGIRITSEDRNWDEVRSLARVYSQDRVQDAFSEWAESKGTDTVIFPLSDFCKVADGLLRGIRTVKANPLTKELINDLVYLSDDTVTFDAKQATAIGKLLDDYSLSEVKEAFKKFFSNIQDDAFLLRRAGKTFVETAEQLLYTQRRRKAEAEASEALQKHLLEQEQALAAKEQAERNARAISEADLVEDHLGL